MSLGGNKAATKVVVQYIHDATQRYARPSRFRIPCKQARIPRLSASVLNENLGAGGLEIGAS